MVKSLKDIAPDLRPPPQSLISKVPEFLLFPTLVVLSLTISSALYSVASVFTIGDLSSVSRSLDDWWEVAGLIGWRIVVLAFGWWGEYDSIDLTTLTVLSHSPHFYLLGAFYNISPITIITCLTVDGLTAYIPLSLLRNTLPTHRWRAARGTVADRVVVNDLSARLLVSLLAAAIYGLAVLGSFANWLPVYLVTHFDGIRDISAAHNANLPLLISLFFPIGAAAGEFLFRASQGTKPDAHDVQTASFNPETASLSQTLAYNFWGYSARTRSLIKRTATVVVITGLHTWLQTYVAIEGVEAYGAAGWSAVWSSAAAVTGLAFWWVGNVENTYKDVESKRKVVPTWTEL